MRDIELSNLQRYSLEYIGLYVFYPDFFHIFSFYIFFFIVFIYRSTDHISFSLLFLLCFYHPFVYLSRLQMRSVTIFNLLFTWFSVTWSHQVTNVRSQRYPYPHRSSFHPHWAQKSKRLEIKQVQQMKVNIFEVDNTDPKWLIIASEQPSWSDHRISHLLVKENKWRKTMSQFYQEEAKVPLCLVSYPIWWDIY